MTLAQKISQLEN